MIQRRLIERAALTTICVATVALATTPSSAKGAASRACVAAYSSAQDRERSGHLREARELLLRCAKPACGALKRKCAAAAEQVTSDLAFVQPIVTDDAGRRLAEAKVTMDEEPLPRMDARGVPVDPGEHRFSFSARVGPWPGHEVSITRTVAIAQGQRGPLALALTLAVEDGADDDAQTGSLAHASDTQPAADATKPPEHPAPTAPEQPTPDVVAAHDAPPVRGGRSALPYLIGGVGLLGVGAGALLTYWGKGDNDALGQCAPNCQPSSVAHIRQLYLAADLSIGAGAAALAVSGWLFATSRSGEAGSVAAKPPAAYLFDVQPMRAGAVATVKGAF